MDLRSKKLRFSRMFRPSFAASCTSRTIAQVVHRSVLIHRPSSLPDSSRTIFGDSGVVPLSFPNGSRFPRRTLSERYPPSVLRDDDYLGRRCPPSTPITPFIRRLPQPPVPSLGENTTGSRVRRTEKTKTKKQATVATEEEEEEEKEKCPYSSSTTSQEDWFSNESDACLSTSRSLSSDSSETRCRRCRRRRGGAAGAGVLPLAGREIKDSFAVVKRSSDPRGDFQRSMVEMIMEKEMFGAEELQKLLECFLALNSHHHHREILQAFTEIWEALFSSRP